MYSWRFFLRKQSVGKISEHGYSCFNKGMSNSRLISIAAGVIPELMDNPVHFIENAASAGWKGTGVWFDPSSWTKRTTQEVAKRIEDSGLVAVDMEVIRIGTEIDHGEALIEAAVAVGAKNILAISSYDSKEQTAERLTELCSLASDANICVCLEFMRFTSIKNLSDALATVDLVEADNIGILPDLIHVHRSGTSYEEISLTEKSLFPYVQWCDAKTDPIGWAHKDLLTDALDDRMIPGEGELSVREFESLFAPDVPFSIEVRSKDLREAFPDFKDRAKYLLDRTLAALPI